jgi:hypothetical protein
MSSSSEGDKPTVHEKNLQTTSKKQVKTIVWLPSKKQQPQPSFIILCIF